MDKSLDSVYYLDLVNAILPGSRSVLVYRHVMDTIASGIEASPWGFHAYGYSSYVQQSPGNFVAALASYWVEHVSRALAWEAKHPELCLRITYEDLVRSPVKTVSEVQAFWGLHGDLAVLNNAFRNNHSGGPGDYKVDHTTGIHAGSIGQGKRVPIDMLPAPLQEAVNEKLMALGYGALDQSWNSEERAVDGGGVGFWARRLVELMDAVKIEPGQTGIETFALVTEDHRTLRWVIAEAGDVSRGNGDVDGVVTGTAKDLVLLLLGEENLGALLRSGRIRYVVAEQAASQQELARECAELVAVLRGGLAAGV